MKISLCMIVKNEEEVLPRCLDSVKELVDEIVIVDTGSEDKSIEIARTYTENVYPFVWCDDFSAARNFAFSKATGDYLLWLDADDFIFNDEKAHFFTLKRRLEEESPDMVMCPYDVAFDCRGKATSTFYRERLIKRNAGFTWQGRVHECIAPHGKLLYSDFRVAHLGSKKERGARNLNIYRKWAGEETLSGRDQFYYGRELYYHKLYTEAIAVLDGMLAGNGWYVNKIEACRILSYCYTEKGEWENALSALFRSFLYGEPRAFITCEIAKLYRTQNRLREAVFWYEAALSCRDHSAEGDFEQPTARTLVPLLELTRAYYDLGETALAVERHLRAEELFPEHPSVEYNRRFFQAKGLLPPA